MYLSIRKLLQMEAATNLTPIAKIGDAVIDHVVWTLQHLVIRRGFLWRRRHFLIPREAIRREVWSTWISIGLTEKEIFQPEAMARRVGGRWVAGAGIAREPSTGPGLSAAPATVVVSPDTFSAREMLGYRVEAQTGSVGYLDDFICDEQRWLCVALLVRKGRLSRTRFLAPVQWVRDVDHRNGTIHISADASDIEDAVRTKGADIAETDVKTMLAKRTHLDSDPVRSHRG
jgi:hypothetical protein